MSEAKERQQVASYKMQSALLEIKGYADRGEKLYPRTILELWEQEGLAEAIDQAALAAPPLPNTGVREALERIKVWADRHCETERDLAIALQGVRSELAAFLAPGQREALPAGLRELSEPPTHSPFICEHGWPLPMDVCPQCPKPEPPLPSAGLRELSEKEHRCIARALRTAAAPSQREADYDAPERRAQRDLVTAVMAVVSGAPADNLPEDCAQIVQHWLKGQREALPAELRELSEKATQGPWVVSEGRAIEAAWETHEVVQLCSMNNSHWSTDPRYDDVELNRRRNERMRTEAQSNGRFIVACVNYVRAALARSTK